MLSHKKKKTTNQLIPPPKAAQLFLVVRKLEDDKDIEVNEAGDTGSAWIVAFN